MADQPARGERLPLNDQLEAALQQVCEQQDLTSLDDAAMKFDRVTPLDDTNEKDNAETEWF